MAAPMANTDGISDAALAEQRFQARHEHLRDAFGHFNIEAQMTEFLSTVTLDPISLQLRQRVLHDLDTVLQPYFKKVRLHPFGSLISGLGEKDSDLDVFVDCYGNAMTGTSMDKDLKIRTFKKVLRILRGNRDRGSFMFRMVIQIPFARVPIIKFIHVETDIHCDLSFENMLSIRNSQLVQFLAELDPRVRPLICLIRYWGKYHQLTDSLKIKNYAVTLLVLVFLTRKRILPSVYQLQHWDPPPPEFRVNYWNASFYSNKDEIIKVLDSDGRPPVTLNEFNQPTALSILELAMEFFQFFKDFQADQYVVCTLTSEFIPRSLFHRSSEHDLPKELEDYKTFCQDADMDPELRRLETGSHMSWIIQDPFVHNFNVGAVTRDIILFRFLRACASTAEFMSLLLDLWKNGKDSPSPNIMDIFCDVDFTDLPQNRKELKILQAREAARQIADAAGDPKLQTTADGLPAQHEVNQIALPDESIVNFNRNVSIPNRLSVPLCEVQFTLKPPDAFRNQFTEIFSISGLTSSYILRKEKVLWFLFMKDYFRLFFTKCLNLEVGIEESEMESANNNFSSNKTNQDTDKSNAESQGGNSSVTNKIEHTYANPFLATLPYSSEIAPKSQIDSVDDKVKFSQGQAPKRQMMSPMRNQGTNKPPYAKYHKTSATSQTRKSESPEIPECHCQPGQHNAGHQKLKSLSDEMYMKQRQMVLRCSGKSTIWEGRKVALRQLRKEDYIKKWLHQSGDTEISVDPMEIEAEITRRLKGNSAPFVFDCLATFQCSNGSIEVDVKEVMFPLRKPSRSLAAINAVTTMLQDIHEKYILFRLAKWLEDVAKPLPESNRRTEVPSPPLPPPVTATISTTEKPVSGIGRGRGRGRGSLLQFRAQQLPAPSIQMF